MKRHSAKVVVEEGGVSYFAWSIITDGFFSLPYYRKYIGKPLRLEIMLLEKGHGRWAVDINNLKDLTSLSLDKLEKGAYAIGEMEKLHLSLGRKVLAGSNKLRKCLSGGSQAGLAKDLQKNWNDFLDLNGVGTVLVWTDIGDNLFTEHLKAVLSSRGAKEDNLQSYLSLLVSQAKPSAQWRETLELLRIGIANKFYGKAVESSRFKAHCEKYRWIQYGYHGPESPRSFFSKRLKKAFQVGIRHELRKHASHYSDMRKHQRSLEKKLRLTTSDKRLFGVARRIMYLKAYRVDVRYYFHWIMDSMFRSLGREHGVPFQWFLYAERKDIIRLIKGKQMDIRPGMQRARFLLRVKDGKATEFMSKRTGRAFLKRILATEEVKDASEIKGNVAYPGLVRGIVRVVHSSRDMAKVRKGDVLAALATNPDLLPAMSRASAFITDSGGITSHAAIVAREMKKPCIIGTRIATKVLKDGDKVEVDANKGIVRKL